MRNRNLTITKGELKRMLEEDIHSDDTKILFDAESEGTFMTIEDLEPDTRDHFFDGQTFLRIKEGG